jgi:hypothetical protein
LYGSRSLFWLAVGYSGSGEWTDEFGHEGPFLIWRYGGGEGGRCQDRTFWNMMLVYLARYLDRRRTAKAREKTYGNGQMAAGAPVPNMTSYM